MAQNKIVDEEQALGMMTVGMDQQTQERMLNNLLHNQLMGNSLSKKTSLFYRGHKKNSKSQTGKDSNTKRSRSKTNWQQFRNKRINGSQHSGKRPTTVDDKVTGSQVTVSRTQRATRQDELVSNNDINWILIPMKDDKIVMNHIHTFQGPTISTERKAKLENDSLETKQDAVKKTSLKCLVEVVKQEEPSDYQDQSQINKNKNCDDSISFGKATQKRNSFSTQRFADAQSALLKKKDDNQDISPLPLQLKQSQDKSFLDHIDGLDSAQDSYKQNAPETTINQNQNNNALLLAQKQASDPEQIKNQTERISENLHDDDLQLKKSIKLNENSIQEVKEEEVSHNINVQEGETSYVSNTKKLSAKFVQQNMSKKDVKIFKSSKENLQQKNSNEEDDMQLSNDQSKSSLISKNEQIFEVFQKIIQPNKYRNCLVQYKETRDERVKHDLLKLKNAVQGLAHCQIREELKHFDCNLDQINKNTFEELKNKLEENYDFNFQQSIKVEQNNQSINQQLINTQTSIGVNATPNNKMRNRQNKERGFSIVNTESIYNERESPSKIDTNKKIISPESSAHQTGRFEPSDRFNEHSSTQSKNGTTRQVYNKDLTQRPINKINHMNIRTPNIVVKTSVPSTHNQNKLSQEHLQSFSKGKNESIENKFFEERFKAKSRDNKARNTFNMQMQLDIPPNDLNFQPESYHYHQSMMIGSRSNFHKNFQSQSFHQRDKSVEQNLKSVMDILNTSRVQFKGYDHMKKPFKQKNEQTESFRKRYSPKQSNQFQKTGMTSNSMLNGFSTRGFRNLRYQSDENIKLKPDVILNVNDKKSRSNLANILMQSTFNLSKNNQMIEIPVKQQFDARKSFNGLQKYMLNKKRESSVLTKSMLELNNIPHVVVVDNSSQNQSPFKDYMKINTNSDRKNQVSKKSAMRKNNINKQRAIQHDINMIEQYTQRFGNANSDFSTLKTRISKTMMQTSRQDQQSPMGEVSQTKMIEKLPNVTNGQTKTQDLLIRKHRQSSEVILMSPKRNDTQQSAEYKNVKESVIDEKRREFRSFMEMKQNESNMILSKQEKSNLQSKGKKLSCDLIEQSSSPKQYKLENIVIQNYQREIDANELKINDQNEQDNEQTAERNNFELTQNQSGIIGQKSGVTTSFDDDTPLVKGKFNCNSSLGKIEEKQSVDEPSINGRKERFQGCTRLQINNDHDEPSAQDKKINCSYSNSTQQIDRENQSRTGSQRLSESAAKNQTHCNRIKKLNDQSISLAVKNYKESVSTVAHETDELNNDQQKKFSLTYNQIFAPQMSQEEIKLQKSGNQNSLKKLIESKHDEYNDYHQKNFSQIHNKEVSDYNRFINTAKTNTKNNTTNEGSNFYSKRMTHDEIEIVSNQPIHIKSSQSQKREIATQGKKQRRSQGAGLHILQYKRQYQPNKNNWLRNIQITTEKTSSLQRTTNGRTSKNVNSHFSLPIGIEVKSSKDGNEGSRVSQRGQKNTQTKVSTQNQFLSQQFSVSSIMNKEEANKKENAINKMKFIISVIDQSKHHSEQEQDMFILGNNPVNNLKLLQNQNKDVFKAQSPKQQGSKGRRVVSDLNQFQCKEDIISDSEFPSSYENIRNLQILDRQLVQNLYGQLTGIYNINNIQLQSPQKVDEQNVFQNQKNTTKTGQRSANKVMSPNVQQARNIHSSESMKKNGNLSMSNSANNKLKQLLNASSPVQPMNEVSRESNQVVLNQDAQQTRHIQSLNKKIDTLKLNTLKKGGVVDSNSGLTNSEKDIDHFIQPIVHQRSINSGKIGQNIFTTAQNQKRIISKGRSNVSFIQSYKGMNSQNMSQNLLGGNEDQFASSRISRVNITSGRLSAKMLPDVNNDATSEILKQNQENQLKINSNNQAFQIDSLTFHDAKNQQASNSDIMGKIENHFEDPSPIVSPNEFLQSIDQNEFNKILEKIKQNEMNWLIPNDITEDKGALLTVLKKYRSRRQKSII